MKYLITIFLIFNIYLFANNTKNNTYARLLLHGNCITCHHQTKNISAPSLEIIIKRYKQAFPKKEDFVSYMSTWVLYPKEQTSIMRDMITKYELMPELGYDKDTLEKISNYLYHMEIRN